MSYVAWNGPICSKCHGSGAMKVLDVDAKICDECGGSGLGKIGHGSALVDAPTLERLMRGEKILPNPHNVILSH